MLFAKGFLLRSERLSHFLVDDGLNRSHRKSLSLLTIVCGCVFEFLPI
jgi:hypothetical protein